MKDYSLIPIGCYCYDENGVCPYWDGFFYGNIRNGASCYEAYAYCSMLEIESIEYDPFNLLWDSVKECGFYIDGCEKE
jgi:hypothetical protein